MRKLIAIPILTSVSYKTKILLGILSAAIIAAAFLAVTLLIETQQADDEPNKPEVAVAEEEYPVVEKRPAPVFPESTAPGVKIEDFPYAGIDERSSYRVFTIPTEAKEAVVLIAANLDDPLWQHDRNDDDSLITRLFDGDAAFGGIAAYDISNASGWESIKAHIGGFSQDYCGDVTVIYSFRKKGAFAVTGAGSINFASSSCPLTHVEFQASSAWKENLEDEYGEFCRYRSKCLMDYFDVKENRVNFIPKWLEQVAAIPINVPPKKDSEKSMRTPH